MIIFPAMNEAEARTIRFYAISVATQNRFQDMLRAKVLGLGEHTQFAVDMIDRLGAKATTEFLVVTLP